MTNLDFNNDFDILYNSISSNQAPSLTEEEKSVFLTTAQEGLVIELYSGRNSTLDSFEKTEEVREYLSSLVKTDEIDPIIYVPTHTVHKLSDNSKMFSLPPDLWFITYETVKLSDESLGCLNNTYIDVIPATQDDLQRLLKNPFKGPNKRRALRLNIDNSSVEIISKYNIDKYKIRYLSKVPPIVIDLEDTDNNQECVLHPALHRTILSRAVQLAIASMNLGK